LAAAVAGKEAKVQEVVVTVAAVTLMLIWELHQAMEGRRRLALEERALVAMGAVNVILGEVLASAAA
jgi:hypothetical protein